MADSGVRILRGLARALRRVAPEITPAMKINSVLKAIPFILAAGFPTSLAAGSLGVSVPSVLAPTTLFGAFVIVLTLLTLALDYRAPRPLRAGSLEKDTERCPDHAHFPLAA